MDQKIWYYADGDEPVGAFSKQDLLHFKAIGRINDTTLIWCEGMEKWSPLETKFSVGQTNTDIKPPALAPNTVATNPANIETGDNQVGEKRTFFEAIKVCFQKAFVFSGRASRSEYWWFILFSVLIGAISGFVDFALSSFSALVSLILFFPSLAVAIRRMHDVKRSGWWVGSLYLSPLAFFLPVILATSGQDATWLFAVIGFIYLLNVGIVLVFSLKKGIPE